MGNISLDRFFAKNDWVDNENSHSLSLKDIAIIGVSLKLPYANTLGELWDVLINGIETKRELPESRKNDCIYCAELLDKSKDDCHFYEGSFLSDVDKFDAGFFGNSPREADYMSIIQRMLLQGAISSIYDAGYPLSQLRSSATGVYVGYIGDGDGGQYMNMMKEILPSNRKAMAVTGNLSSVIAGRISYFLDLHGPAYVIDTACSSSLVALHTAVRAIRNGDCEQAIVCSARALAFPLQPDYEIGMESKDGSTRTFDDQAAGTGVGEGMVCLLIKSLEKAKRDRDNIYAVIKGSAVNHDGTTMGITAPNSDAQEKVLIRAWQDANIRPQDLNYIEAHGTGTKLGDPIEITGIERAIQQYTKISQFCPIGSIKSNIGHLYETAGLVSVVKAITCIKHGVVPPTIHFNQPNRMINFINSPVYVADRPVPLPAANCTIGISSFGFSGTNCHVIVSGDKDTEKRCDQKDELFIFPFSAKTESLLIAGLEIFLSWIQSSESTAYTLQDIAYTLTCGRDHYVSGITVKASTKTALTEKLTEILEGIACGRVKPTDQTRKFFDVSGFAGAVRAHIPFRLFDNRRHWFTDTISKSYDGYLNSFRFVDFDVKKVKMRASLHFLIISDRANFASFASAFPDSSCTWLDYDDVDLQSIMDVINSRDTATRVVFCQPEKEIGTTSEQVKQSVSIAHLLLSLVKKLEVAKKLNDIPITLISRKLLSDVNGKIDFSMLYPYAIYKNICCEFIDADISMLDIDSVQESLNWVIDHIDKTFHKVIAVRDGVPFVQSLGSADIGNEKYKVSADGCYVIFGGTGGIGSTIVQFLAENGASHIIIAQRSQSNIAALMKKTAVYACQIETVTCDISSKDDVFALFRSIDIRNIRVKGVAHCAGAAGKTLLRGVDELRSLDIIAPKIEGLLNIEHAITLYKCCENLDFFILCSSAMALIGVPGQAQYAVGNTFMDLYAAQLRSRGIPACAVDWTAWNDVGIAKVHGFDKREELLKSIGSNEARGLFSLLLCAEQPRVVVGEIRYSMITDAVLCEIPFELGIDRPLSHEREHDNRNTQTKKKAVTVTSKEEIERILLNIVTDVTGLADLNIGDNLTEVGGDSITLARIHEEVDVAFPGAILMSQMFVYPSIEKLSEYIVEQLHIPPTSSSSMHSDADSGEISVEDAIALLEKI